MHKRGVFEKRGGVRVQYKKKRGAQGVRETRKMRGWGEGRISGGGGVSPPSQFYWNSPNLHFINVFQSFFEVFSTGCSTAK